MEVRSICSEAVAIDRTAESVLKASVIQIALVAQRSLIWILFTIGSLPNDIDAIQNSLGADKRFPLSDLNKVTEPVAENKDASESDDDEENENAEDEDEDDDDVSGEEGSDDDDDSDDDVEANGDGESDDDDDDDEGDSDEEDGDDSDEEDDDEEDDEEMEGQPPYKKSK